MQNQTITSQLVQDWADFSQQIQNFIANLGLNDLSCDHVAIRVNSNAAADELRDYFLQRGQLISNNLINGRPILIFELSEPMQLGELSIECVELPYPGDKAYPMESWEHIELVLPGGATSIETLREQLLERVPTLAPVLAQETEIKVKMSSPKGAHERLPNPTIAFKRGHLCIKVHPHGIKTVIASEAK